MAGSGLAVSVELDDWAQAPVATAALSAVDNINFFSIFVSSFAHKCFVEITNMFVTTTHGGGRRSLFRNSELVFRSGTGSSRVPDGALESFRGPRSDDR